MSISAKKNWLPAVKRFFRKIVSKFDLEAHELEILHGTCDCLQRFYEVREILDRDGLVFKTESGQIKKHPLAEVERQSWASFLSGMKALPFANAIDNDVLGAQKKGPGRPLRVVGNAS